MSGVKAGEISQQPKQCPTHPALRIQIEPRHGRKQNPWPVAKHEERRVVVDKEKRTAVCPECRENQGQAHAFQQSKNEQSESNTKKKFCEKKFGIPGGSRTAAQNDN